MHYILEDKKKISLFINLLKSINCNLDPTVTIIWSQNNGWLIMQNSTFLGQFDMDQLVFISHLKPHFFSGQLENRFQRSICFDFDITKIVKLLKSIQKSVKKLTFQIQSQDQDEDEIDDNSQEYYFRIIAQVEEGSMDVTKRIYFKSDINSEVYFQNIKQIIDESEKYMEIRQDYLKNIKEMKKQFLDIIFEQNYMSIRQQNPEDQDQGQQININGCYLETYNIDQLVQGEKKKLIIPPNFLIPQTHIAQKMGKNIEMSFQNSQTRIGVYCKSKSDQMDVVSFFSSVMEEVDFISPQNPFSDINVSYTNNINNTNVQGSNFNQHQINNRSLIHQDLTNQQINQNQINAPSQQNHFTSGTQNNGTQINNQQYKNYSNYPSSNDVGINQYSTTENDDTNTQYNNQKLLQKMNINKNKIPIQSDNSQYQNTDQEEFQSPNKNNYSTLSNRIVEHLSPDKDINLLTSLNNKNLQQSKQLNQIPNLNNNQNANGKRKFPLNQQNTFQEPQKKLQLMNNNTNINITNISSINHNNNKTNFISNQSAENFNIGPQQKNYKNGSGQQKQHNQEESLINYLNNNKNNVNQQGQGLNLFGNASANGIKIATQNSTVSSNLNTIGNSTQYQQQSSDQQKRKKFKLGQSGQ